jgi:predicted GH43/DUF377 family glycosyl hydrolase
MAAPEHAPVAAQIGRVKVQMGKRENQRGRGRRHVQATTSLLVIGAVLSTILLTMQPARAQEEQTKTLNCEKPGWFPTEFGLKDHHVFWYDEYYYLVSIYVPRENRFAYARTQDFCDWEDMTPIMAERTRGEWDEGAIWAPFVLEEEGTYYMFYTGMTRNYTQSIMVATTSDPSDPDSWEREGMIFQPDHEDMLWDPESWADCRDPTVIKVEDVFYMYYTGMDQSGGIIGLASAASPLGPWQDWGAVFEPIEGFTPESPTVAYKDRTYYLFYNQPGISEYFRIGGTPAGPWIDGSPFTPGWAHEIWQDIDGNWFTSFLTDYTVTISPLIWDDLFQPPHPFIGAQVHHLMLPYLLR